MSILSEKQIYDAMLPHLGTFASYEDLCEAAYRETLKMVGELENPFEGYFDAFENIRMAKSQGFERFREALNKLEVSNGH